MKLRILLITILCIYSCTQEVNQKIENTNEALDYLVNNKMDSVHFGDSVLLKSNNNRFTLLINGKRKYYIITKKEVQKSLYSIQTDKYPMNKFVRNKIGDQIFQRLCFVCHTPIDFSKSIFINRNSKFYNDSIENVIRNKYFLVSYENKHWQFFILNNVSKRILIEYIDERNSDWNIN